MMDVSKVNLAGSDDDIAEWIWDNLIPESGVSNYLQGEILRAIEKLRWEAQNNGNINWDRGFELFVDFLDKTFTSEYVVEGVNIKMVKADLKRLRSFISPLDLKNDTSKISQLPYVEDDLYDRLVHCLVLLCQKHSDLIPYTPNPEQYR